jgi:hypothetical protein
MSAKIILAIILITAAAGIFFLPDSKKIENQPETVQSTLPQTVEDLVKQSANEMTVQPVAPPPSPIAGSSTSAQFSCNGTTFVCYEDYYRGLVKQKGVVSAFADLKNRYAQDAYVQSQCHPITHVIGTTATQIYPKVAQAYAQGDSYCWSGYYHGVMEGIVGVISSQELPKQMDSLCNEIPGKASYSFDYYNCVHGLGHGVMAITQNELFDSLKLCDNLVGGWEQSSCHGGVFMENVIIDNKNHFTKYLKPEEPLYPCTAVDDKYKTTCYLMQTSYMLKVTAGDFAKVFELCSQVGNHSVTCYQSLGRDASGRSISQVEPTKSTCNLGTDYDQKSNCVVGAVKDFISYHHSDVQAKQLCAALETELQTICYSTAESYYKSF